MNSLKESRISTIKTYMDLRENPESQAQDFIHFFEENGRIITDNVFQGENKLVEYYNSNKSPPVTPSRDEIIYEGDTVTVRITILKIRKYDVQFVFAKDSILFKEIRIVKTSFF